MNIHILSLLPPRPRSLLLTLTLLTLTLSPSGGALNLSRCPQFIMQPRLARDSLSSCLRPQGAGDAGVRPFAQLSLLRY